MRPDLLLVRGSARFASKKSVILYAWRRQVTVLPTAPVCSQFCTYFQIYSPCHLAVSFLATSSAYEVSFFSSSNHNLVHPWASCPIIPNTVLVPLTMVITLSCQFDGRGRREILCRCPGLEMFHELRFESPQRPSLSWGEGPHLIGERI